MKIAICDDMPNEAKLLASLLNGEDVTVFHDPNELIKYIQDKHKIDVCFLDVLMPEMNGIELAKKLRTNGFSNPIVYCTTSKEYAFDAFGVAAFDYLLKPPTQEDVEMTLKKLKSKIKEDENQFLTIKTINNWAQIPFKEISHAEVISHNVIIYLNNGKTFTINETFKEIMSQLQEKRFKQCHRSYILNVDSIKILEKKDALMINGAIVPISANFRSMIQKSFIEKTVRRG